MYYMPYRLSSSILTYVRAILLCLTTAYGCEEGNKDSCELMLRPLQTIPEDILFDHILPLCDGKSLASLNQTMQRIRFTERAWLSLIIRTFPRFQSASFSGYSNDLLTYKHLYFVLKYLCSPTLFERRQTLHGDEKFVGLINQTFSHRKANYFRGHLTRISGDNKLAWNYYQKAASEHLREARCLIIQAIYDGNLGQNERSENERFQDLVHYAAQGDEQAQERMIDAISYGYLGQDRRPVEKSYEQLIKYALEGNTYAQKKVINAIYYGSLGQKERSYNERFQALINYVENGDQLALERVLDAMYFGYFGQRQRPRQELFRDFTKYAIAGSEHAQRIIIDAIYCGNFGQEERSKEERLQDLKMYALEGNTYAQKRLIDAIYSGEWDHIERPEADRLKDLITLAESGNQYASEKIIDAIYSGALGQREKSEEERFQNLLNYAVAGTIYAQEKIVKIVEAGTLKVPQAKIEPVKIFFIFLNEIADTLNPHPRRS